MSNAIKYTRNKSFDDIEEGSSYLKIHNQSNFNNPENKTQIAGILDTKTSDPIRDTNDSYKKFPSKYHY